jgi:hypothetical protein
MAKQVSARARLTPGNYVTLSSRQCLWCRLRISLSAAHSEADVDILVAELRACGVLPAISAAEYGPAVCANDASDAGDTSTAQQCADFKPAPQARL